MDIWRSDYHCGEKKRSCIQNGLSKDMVKAFRQTKPMPTKRLPEGAMLQIQTTKLPSYDGTRSNRFQIDRESTNPDQTSKSVLVCSPSKVHIPSAILLLKPAFFEMEVFSGKATDHGEKFVRDKPFPIVGKSTDLAWNVSDNHLQFAVHPGATVGPKRGSIVQHQVSLREYYSSQGLLSSSADLWSKVEIPLHGFLLPLDQMSALHIAMDS